MALGQMQEQPKRRKYLSIHHGKVELSDNGQKSYFSYVEGGLLSIYCKERTYGTEKVTKWFMDLRDDEGELYTISFPYNSGTFKSIVLSMASVHELSCSTVFRIEPYQKGNFTNVVVYGNGSKLDWVTKDLPPVEDVKVGSQTYRDDSKRMTYIISLVDNINRQISQ